MSGIRHFFPTRRLVRGPRLLMWGAMIFLFCPGCDDSIDLCEPPVPAGRVQGWIRSGGLTLNGYVVATNSGKDYPERSEFRTEPNEAGFYSFDLPPGRYTFQLKISGGYYDYIESGIGFGQVPPDTVEVGAGISPPEINFDLGGVTLGFDLPKEMHGQYCQVALYPSDNDEWDNWRRVTTGIGEIVTGRLEVEIVGVVPGEYQVELNLGSVQNAPIAGSPAAANGSGCRTPMTNRNPHGTPSGPIRFCRSPGGCSESRRGSREGFPVPGWTWGSTGGRLCRS